MVRRPQEYPMQRLDPSLIRGFDLFRSMSEDELRAILADARTRQIPKGAALFEQGTDAREFFVLLDGRLKVVQVTPDGEQVVIRFVVPGELCGVAVALRRPDYPATASAAIDSLALVWDSRSWDSLCARAPALAMNALHTMGQRLQEAHTRIREMSTEEVERRVAHALLRLVSQSGRKTEHGMLIDFPVTRQDIAEMTGATLHTVSRILSAWEGKGYVQSGRQRITVREAHKLFLLAEGAAQGSSSEERG
jgi:CRP/FNR family transcriptional regulator, nitrogen oxide reductase regulator